MPLAFQPPRLLFAPLAALVVCAGCHAQNPMPGLWSTATRVPPPTTNSYGKAAPYYPAGAQRGAIPAAIPTSSGLPPGSPAPPAGNMGQPVNGASGVTPLMPPPPSVPATGARPAPTSGAFAEPYSVTPPAALPSVPPTMPPTMSPTVPPTYLSTPARVDTLIQPVSGQAFDQDAAPPANNLRWGVR